MTRCKRVWYARIFVTLAWLHACGLVSEDRRSGGAGGAAGAGVDSGGTSASGAGGSAWDAMIDVTADAADAFDIDAGAPPCPQPGVMSQDAGTRPSCAKGPLCACGLSCCDARLVPGGWFPMGRSLDGSDASDAWGLPDELPEHPAKVSDFYLDTFEVTVARFREFVEQYPASLPKPGAGAHPEIPNSGWHKEWNALVPATRAELEADLDCEGSYVPGQYPTWTSAPSAFESYPLNCVDWYEAFAFCAWDGGRLPTEAEWEYAAAGGDENRRYPWGSYWPLDVSNSAEWAFAHACIASTCLGTPPASWGLARWGQFAMAGSLWEWALDEPAPYSGDPCSPCTSYQPGAINASAKGGAWICYGQHIKGWGAGAECVRSVARKWESRNSNGAETGIRCARSP